MTAIRRRPGRDRTQGNRGTPRSTLGYGSARRRRPIAIAARIATGIVATASSIGFLVATSTGVAHALAAGTISTVAGGTGSGTATNVAQTSGFVSIGPSGDLYVNDSEYGEESVHEISPAGTETTVAGDGYVGYSSDAVPATSTGLYPQGTGIDPYGDLVIADFGNQRIRLVAAATCMSGCPYGLASTTEGDIYTVAGDGTSGLTGNGGPATSAEISWPRGVAFDNSGDLLIADSENSEIRLVAAANCSSSCPFGLASMTEGDIYAIAGDGTSGYTGNNGPATSAELELPYGIAVDSAGDLIIADTYNQRVRLVAAASCSSSCPYGLASTTKDDIYTIAGDGAGQYAGDGGPGTSASLYYPYGVGVDGSGNILIADTQNDVIRMLAASTCSSSCAYGLASTTEGDIYTIAGDNTGGFSGDSGPATSAEIDSPQSVVVDSSGDLVIGDAGNARVRLVAASTCASSCAYGLASTTKGDIYTIAGNGSDQYSGNSAPATGAELDYPGAVAFDSSGDLVIADGGNQVVRMVAASTCSSNCPYGLASTIEGDIYAIAGDGTSGYTGDDGPATSAELSGPSGLAFDSSHDLLIGDGGNNVVRLVAAANCSSSCPYGLGSMTKGDIYTVAGNGTGSYSGDSGPAAAAELDGPSAVAVDSSGDILIEDDGNARVRMVAASTCSSSCPFGLASTTKDDIYTIAGDGTSGYSGDDGPATSAELGYTFGFSGQITLDGSGDLLIADYLNSRIRLVAATTCSSSCPFGLSSTTKGDIYTVAGDATSGFSGDDGPATSAELDVPEGVTVDPSGDLLISDQNNERIRMVAASTCSSSCPFGLASTTKDDIYSIAGDGTYGFSGDGGPATSAELWAPAGLATDSAGNLYIADSGNFRIREMTTQASGPTSTSTTLASSLVVAGIGVSDTYTATVSPVPDGGTVAFDDGAGNPATTDCSAQPVATSGPDAGEATCTVSYPSTSGSPFTVTATYSGDANFSGSESSTLTFYVIADTQLAITSAALSFTASPSAVNKLTVTAENSSGTPTDLPGDVNLGVSFSTTSPLTDGGGFCATSGCASPSSTLLVTMDEGTDTASAYYGDTVSGWPVITASNPGVASGTQVETVKAGAVVAADSTVQAAPTTQAADGVGASTVTVTLKDQYGNGVPAKTVTLAQTGATHATLTTLDGTTNQDGQALFSVTDSTAETVTLQADDTTDSSVGRLEGSGQEPAVTFVSPLPDVLAVLPGSGALAGGTSVVVCGLNFTGVTAVDFGAAAGTGVSLNATMDAACPSGSTQSLSVTAPAGGSAGTVNVTVTVGADTSASTSLDGYIYTISGPYYPVTPYRVCDTRTDNPSDTSGTDAQCNGLTLPAGSTSAAKGDLSFTVDGTYPSGTFSGGIPATNVTAVVLNVTVVNAKASSGSLTLWATGSPVPDNANLNWWSAGSNVSNQAEVAVGTGGQVSVHNDSTGTTDVSVTIEGYVGPVSGDTGLFTPVSEFRVTDTRSSSGYCNAGDPLGAHTSLTVQVTGTLSCQSDSDTGVPSTGVSAVLVKVAEVSSTAGGTLAAYPAGSEGNVTLAGVTNFVKGEVLSNHATIGVGDCTTGADAGCSVTVYNNSTGTTNVTIDVLGYYTSSTGTGGTQFNAVAPLTICDSRKGDPSALTGTQAQCDNGTTGSTLHSDTTENFTCSETGASDCESFAATGMGGVPASAASVVLNVTVVDPTAGGNLLVSSPANFVSGNPLPTATIAFSAGYSLNALVVESPNASGDLEVWNQSSGTSDVVVSVVGWYQ